jgi:2-polyprenyl-6-methoxyphenol hydroxylase-like FAD-dependent oxidoreductase
VPRTEHEAADFVREFWSGRLRVGVCPCAPTATFVYLIAPLSDRRGARTPIDADYWAAHFPQLAAEGLFERAGAIGGVHHPYPLVGTRAWSSGRVALVGDAAHALPPTLGQGAGLSLTNGLLLADYVSRGGDVPGALRSWEHDWRWITDRTQRWARRYDWITSEWPPSIHALRDALIWGLGKVGGFNDHMRIADRVDAPNRRVIAAKRGSGSRSPR